MSTAPTLLETLLICEGRVWEALRSGDMQADSAALCDSFFGVYSDGFAGKAAHVGQLADGPTVASYQIVQAKARALGAGYAMLSYRAEFRRSGRREVEAMYVSSIWQQRDESEGGGWVNIFSQDTPAR